MNLRQGTRHGQAPGLSPPRHRCCQAVTFPARTFAGMISGATASSASAFSIKAASIGPVIRLASSSAGRYPVTFISKQRSVC